MSERISTYAVSGQTGPQLYSSIGEKSPVIAGTVRAIAHTTFKLTWKRQYVPQGNGCSLVSAVPTLVITYTLPKASTALPQPVRGNWAVFLNGVERHERVHGEHIKQMVREIEAQSVGLTVQDDPKCQKIRAELTRRLGVISDRKRDRDRAFEQTEMAPGGPIQQLILALVNGG
ncbi:putative secreted Zn-dependent protease [Agrobacterium vitis]|nr:putative secreted Zn-dependent protease [Agrobacterium vitis]MBE1440169.1 putative secreted Zn-dependent protease [Agrobacterium vitis]